MTSSKNETIALMVLIKCNLFQRKSKLAQSPVNTMVSMRVAALYVNAMITMFLIWCVYTICDLQKPPRLGIQQQLPKK